MTVYSNYSGNYNGFRHIIADNNNPVNSRQTCKLKSMLLGERIRELRAEHGVLQRQLAALLEIDTPMFSKIERGDRRAKRTQVIQLAEYFNIDKNGVERIAGIIAVSHANGIQFIQNAVMSAIAHNRLFVGCSAQSPP